MSRSFELIAELFSVLSRAIPQHPQLKLIGVHLKIMVAKLSTL